MRIYVYAAILAALMAGAGFLYLKGQSDAKARIEAERDAARIEDLKRSRERRDEIDDLSDDDLRDRLIERLRPAGPQ